MFDSNMVEHKSLNQSDKKSYKRPVIEYVINRLREANKRATITEEDFFYRQHPLFASNELLMKEINEKLGETSKKYDGFWVMKMFSHIEPGPEVGKILKHLSDTFGRSLDVVPEKSVLSAVFDYFNIQQKG
jgi:hypothetical protein